MSRETNGKEVDVKYASNWLNLRIIENTQRTHMAAPIFTWLSGDSSFLDYGGKWISQRMRNGPDKEGGFDFWLVAELLNWEDAVGEREAAELDVKYNLTVSVVSPSQVPDNEWASALSSCGWDGMDIKNKHVQVELLHGYGIKAEIWQEDGNSFKKLWREMHKDLRFSVGVMFGFTMDKPVNKIGSTGWDAIKGDITAGLRRYSEDDSQELQTVRKMHGMPTTLEEAELAVTKGEMKVEEEPK